jgi:carbamoyl-phosphate synthase large subunit
VGVDGFNLKTVDMERIEDELAYPRAERLWYVADAFGVGMSLEEIHKFTKIDRWFLAQVKDLVDTELDIEKRTLADFSRRGLAISSARASPIAGSPTSGRRPSTK